MPFSELCYFAYKLPLKLKRKAGRIWFTGLKTLCAMNRLFSKASETISTDLGGNTESKAVADQLTYWSVTGFKLLLCLIQSHVE